MSDLNPCRTCGEPQPFGKDNRCDQCISRTANSTLRVCTKCGNQHVFNELNPICSYCDNDEFKARGTDRMRTAVKVKGDGMIKRNKSRIEDVLLSPEDHPVGTRLILTDSYQALKHLQVLYEATVVEWSPSNTRVRLKYPHTEHPIWIDPTDYYPLVKEILPSEKRFFDKENMKVRFGGKDIPFTIDDNGSITFERPPIGFGLATDDLACIHWSVDAGL